jgi:hypothetical protein
VVEFRHQASRSIMVMLLSRLLAVLDAHIFLAAMMAQSEFHLAFKTETSCIGHAHGDQAILSKQLCQFRHC